MHLLKYFFTGFVVLMPVLCNCQNQFNKWYFGNVAGLNFMTTPPSPLTGAMITSEGCASIADAAGNLLFYTDGSTIWNSANTIMGNGTGLGGNSSTTQSSIIVKQPGNANIYFVFSLSLTGVLVYCIVDMNLAAGLGSVTVNNLPVSMGNTEKLTSVRHCNGVDYWVLCAPNSASFNAYLVSSAGVSTTPVSSSVPGIATSIWGNMKVSPNGSKIAFANASPGTYKICDFNTATGVASNVIQLGTGALPYGVEFSPDGTKLYGTHESGTAVLRQWDLCAGSATAIAASQYSVIVPTQIMGMQLGTDGKIYIARYGSYTLAVINTPNASGAACNYIHNGIVISPGQSRYNLPNFISSGFNPPPPAFSYTVNNAFGCQAAMFFAPPIAQPTAAACSAMGTSVTSVWWNFGDPASAPNNTSNITNPTHAFTSLGTYTVKMVFNYSCGGSSDTVNALVVIDQPCISVTSQSITCASLGSATVTATGGIGPFSYTWMPGNQATPVATNLNPGTYTLTVYDQGNSFTYTALTTFVSPVPFTGLLDNTAMLLCNGAATGTAAVQLNGGSGTHSYAWISGSGTQTTATASGLAAGLHTLLVVDAVTSCSVNQSFFINQPTPVFVSVSAGSPTACVGNTIGLTGMATGGTPGSPAYTYSWLPAGPAGNTRSVSTVFPGNYVFTLSAVDGNSCSATGIATVTFVANPSLGLASASICPQQTATLTATGAASYTWADGSTAATFTDNPLSTTVYSVTGETAGCTSTIAASVVLKAVPVVTLSSNTPVCDGQMINFYSSPATAWLWNGPATFSSSLQNPQITPAAINNSGTYNATVTAANQCTASASIVFSVNPTPTVSAIGSTVCNTQTVILQGNSSATDFYWMGPLSFTSALQNPSINAPQVAASGIYTLLVTAAGCTNFAMASVTVTAVPTVTFTTNSPRCVGNTLNFNSSGSSLGNYSWTGPGAFSSLAFNPSIPNIGMSAAGIYTLTLTFGPCTATFTDQVVVHPLPVPLIQSNSPVCETKALILSVNTFTAYQWNGPAGFTMAVQNGTLTNVVLTQSGIYSVAVTDLNGCQAGTSTSLTVMPNPVLSVTNAAVCRGENAQLQVSGAATYTWSDPQGSASTGSLLSIPSAFNLLPATYTVVGTGLNTCTSVATAVVNTFSLPYVQANITPRACLNSTIAFSSSGGTYYHWSGPIGFSANTQNFAASVNNPGMTGIYTVTVTDDRGCKGYATASFIADLPPQPYLWSDEPSRCVPFCSGFGVRNNGEPITSTSWWVNNVPVSGPTFTYCFSTPGEYILRGIFGNARGCNTSQSFIVNAWPLPLANFEYAPAEVIENNEITFTDLSSGLGLKNRTWFFADNVAHPLKDRNAYHTFEDAGTYPVALLLENQWGCQDTVVRNIVVVEDYHIFIPNAFTPNNDGMNDVLTIVGRGIVSFSMRVFDRWGEQLFESSDPLKGWDGSYKGQYCKDGVYVWTISVTGLRGKERLLKGSVMLYR